MTSSSSTQESAASAAGGVPRVSEKDRKTDILAAYNELLKKYEERASKAKDREQEVKRTKEEATVRSASGYTVDKIVQGCRNLETAIRAYLMEISDKLLQEARHLQEVQEAIAIEEQQLEEIHDIKISATALAELIDTYKGKQKECEEERERQLRVLEQELQARREQWKREEEEYAYTLSQKRKREEDVYQQKRETTERELEERKQILALQEQDLNQLRKRAESFDEELKAAIQTATKESEKTVRQEEKTRADFLAQQVLREKEIANLTTISLKTRVEEQTREIETLKVQLAAAHKEAKEIALKVIEGATGGVTMRNLQRVTDDGRIAMRE